MTVAEKVTAMQDRFLDATQATVPAELDVHLILDNSAIHKKALIHRWLAHRPRHHLHVTPTTSWQV